ncbi:hypothetical protein FUA48_11950 [Flavobacterium alkalisoli]|uniref:Alginate export domain-containing protein n=1 Tax=Flavobacterium alkalisoli TaxID=2602769 RepID=A0A5B9FTE3_9FLAO|nr:alginate export family protein [Flavobacterium alkalisoli]QEE50265.1 hypothetical protein FUA48_11950 [Flavobacterium alkalisoli]
MTRLFFLFFLCICCCAAAQQSMTLGRQQKDTLTLGDSAPDGYKSLKRIQIGKDGHAGFGGSCRFQYLLLDNENWNPASRDPDGYLLSRWLFHTELQFGNRFRLFAELQSALAGSRIAPVPVEENALEAHQLFMEFQPLESIPLTIRLGRQEVSFGSQRLISLRDAPNSRRSFDGVEGIYAREKFRASMFYLHAVLDKLGIFDDRSSPELKVWGLFLDRTTFGSLPNLNFYYLGFYNRHALFYDGPGMEKRHTLAARVFSKDSRWNYDLEGGYQFGSIGRRGISAWSIAFSTTYSFSDMKYAPELGCKADIISGDGNPYDRNQQTLNTMFGPGAYFGMAAPIAPSNLMDVHPGVKLHLTGKITFSFDYAFLWRYSKKDGLYRPNMVPFFESNNATSSYIGSQISGAITYQATPDVLLLLGGSWFNSGDYLSDMGMGKDILLGFAGAQVRL